MFISRQRDGCVSNLAYNLKLGYILIFRMPAVSLCAALSQKIQNAVLRLYRADTRPFPVFEISTVAVGFLPGATLYWWSRLGGQVRRRTRGWEEKGKEAAGGGWDELRMGTGRGGKVQRRAVKTPCQVGGVWIPVTPPSSHKKPSHWMT